jgi:hypothetical protein
VARLAARTASDRIGSTTSGNGSDHADRAFEQPTILSCGNNRVVFNVGRNKYRLVVEVQYQAGIVWVKFGGTHAQYDHIDVESVNDHRDLEPFIGPSGRVSEVLNRKRPLSLRMVKRLHQGLKIPYESLLAEVS